jgi:hypothetical protein
MQFNLQELLILATDKQKLTTITFNVSLLI